MEMSSLQARRDPERLAESLERIRAAHGDDAVGCVQPADGSLPEARFRFVDLYKVPQATVSTLPSKLPLVRRIWLPSRPLERSRGRSRGGPYLLSGGWWRRWIARAYHYRERFSGEILWCYYDRVRQRWFEQGRIE